MTPKVPKGAELPKGSVRSLAPKRPAERGRNAVTSESLRAMNLALVLRNVLANNGEISRAAIAAKTGMTRATVSRLVDELIGAGILEEGGRLEENTRGRPAGRLHTRPSHIYALGLEINISYLNATIVDLSGNVIAQDSLRGNNAGADPVDLARRLAQLGERLVSKVRRRGRIFLGSGLALPGLVSKDILPLAPNLGWRDQSIAEILAPLHSLAPAVVGNEADLAAYAVANPLPGVPSGPANFIYVSGEVGIGAGVVINHLNLPGTHGWSGEIGHICTDPAGPRCNCGNTGCLEAYLGLRALTEAAGMGEEASLDDLLVALRADDSAALAALERAALALGRALAAVVNTVDIPLIFLGGIGAALAPWLVAPALEELRARTIQGPWSDLRIEVAQQPDFQASIGAAHQVLQRLVDDPVAWTVS